MFINATKVEFYDGKVTYTSKVLINLDLVTYIEPSRYNQFENCYTRIHFNKGYIVIQKTFDEVIDILRKV